MFPHPPAQILTLVRDRAFAEDKLRNIGGRPVLLSKPKTNSAPRSRSESIKIALAFVAIYLVWGSTYLAIRYAVETIPPLVTAGIRHTMAGGILLVWAYARGYRPRREHWGAGMILGALFFLIGHGTLHWAEQRVASGLAALLIATEPMFILVLAWATSQQRISRISAVGLAVGVIGVAILTGAELSAKDASLIGLVAVLVGSLSWAAGVVISPKLKLPTDALARTAVPLVCGAVMLLVTAGITGEFHGLHWDAISLKSIFGLGYLIVFGSIVAFSAYGIAVRALPTATVATYAYVNPVIAVLLGALILNERLTPAMFGGGALIVGAVVLVVRRSPPAH